MKAAVYNNPGAPTVVEYVDVPDPDYGPDDVLIAVEAISIEGDHLINRRSRHGVFMGPLFERSAVHATVNELLQVTAEKRLEVVIDRVFPLREASKAHEYAEAAKPLGRVVMIP